MGLRGKFLNGPLGFGTAPLGNMFRSIPDAEAAATIDAAWDAGTRFFDTAPFYGAGLAEIRLGATLRHHPRDEYVLSTKVGRLVRDDIRSSDRRSETGGLFAFGRQNAVVYDYTEHGAMQSIEDSLLRLGVDRLDFVWVHDVAQDFHGDGWLAQFEIARTGAFRALTKLRDAGVIRGWGLGVNRTEPIELILGLAEVNPDGSLLAGRYTLLDHKHALRHVMPAAEKQGVDIVVGGPYSSGNTGRRRILRISASACRHHGQGRTHQEPGRPIPDTRQGCGTAVLSRPPGGRRGDPRSQPAVADRRGPRRACHSDTRRVLARPTRAPGGGTRRAPAHRPQRFGAGPHPCDCDRQPTTRGANTTGTPATEAGRIVSSHRPRARLANSVRE